MAQIVFPEFLKQTGIDLSDHVEAVLLMSNNNAATTPGASTTADITLDAISSLTVYFKRTKDAGNRRVKFTPVESDLTTVVTQHVFPSLAAGARNVTGLLYRTKSTHAVPLLPIAYCDFNSAAAANGEDFKVNCGDILITSGS